LTISESRGEIDVGIGAGMTNAESSFDASQSTLTGVGYIKVDKDDTNRGTVTVTLPSTGWKDMVSDNNDSYSTNYNHYYVPTTT
jgi:hypothetical protein